MRFIFLAGGCVGFVMVGGASALAGHDPARALFDAAVGCLIGAGLFRWFWSVLVRGMQETIRLKAAAPRGAPAAAGAPPGGANGAPPTSPKN